MKKKVLTVLMIVCIVIIALLNYTLFHFLSNQQEIQSTQQGSQGTQGISPPPEVGEKIYGRYKTFVGGPIYLELKEDGTFKIESPDPADPQWPKSKKMITLFSGNFTVEGKKIIFKSPSFLPAGYV